MKRRRRETALVDARNPHRDAQAASPVALFLIDMLADEYSVLSSFLRVSDLFCVRRTCKDAWTRIKHKVLTKHTLWDTAFADPLEPHVPLARWTVAQTYFMSEQSAEYVGMSGHMPLIEESLERFGRTKLLPMLRGAATAGAVEAAVTLAARLDDVPMQTFPTYEAKDAISYGGSIELAQRILPSSTTWETGDWHPALQNGHIAFARWALGDTVLDENQAEGDVWHAAGSKSIELVRWLVEEKGYPITDGAVRRAAMLSGLPMLRWLHERHGGDLQHTMLGAVCNEQLEVAEWLLEQGCTLTDDVLYCAANSSSVRVVRWLLDHDCPYDEGRLIEEACENLEDDAVFPYLVLTKGMRCEPETCLAITERNFLSVDALLCTERGIPLSEDFLLYCVDSGDIERVRFALKHKAPVTVEALCEMFDRVDCAMLHETIKSTLWRGHLTKKVCRLLAGAMEAAEPPVHILIIATLAEFQYWPAAVKMIEISGK